MRPLTLSKKDPAAKKEHPLVNFIIGGTQKGGTTALYEYLQENPAVFMAKKKELHFFDGEKFFRNNTPDYAWYHSQFKNVIGSHKAVGEATPIYMYWQYAPQRIWKYNPDMKLIVILRNPIDRAYSHWNMERSRNTENLSFWDAIQNEDERCRAALPHQHRVYSYVSRGFYLEQLRRLWLYFRKERVLILKHEYLKDQPMEALRDVCDFLEVDRIRGITPKNTHSIPYQTKMTKTEKKYLISVYEHEIRGLERILGWDCSDWLPDK